MTSLAASKVVLQHLRYALAAAEKRSFRQAAIALHLQEPTISRSICVFEGEIGFTLFERGQAGVRLMGSRQALSRAMSAQFSDISIELRLRRSQ